MSDKAKYDKYQTVLVDGEVKANDFKFATGETRVFDFNKKVICPICLSWLPLTNFVVSTEKGYDKENAKCPECKNDVQIKSLFNLNKLKPTEYARFVVEYPAWKFWLKCPRLTWKKNIKLMIWLGVKFERQFWEEYRRLKPSLEDDAKKKKKQFFTKLECRNCIFKAGPYCWGQCPSNIWKIQPDW
jgi:hypothetical protein